jgi:hypothetical protein
MVPLWTRSCTILVCVSLAIIQFRGEQDVRADELDDLQAALMGMDQARSVGFPHIRVGAIENWVSVHRQGIALGQVLRFDRGESRDDLVKCLRYREQYRAFIYQKQRLCNLLAGQLTRLQQGINQQVMHQQQAALAGVRFDSAALHGLQADQQAVRAQAAQAQQEHASMLEEYQKLDGPIVAQFNSLIANYLKACESIRAGGRDSVANMCATLRVAAADPSRFAEKVLLGFAMIRNGENMNGAAGLQLMQELQTATDVTQSSAALGLSPINIDRILLSILCQSGEKLSDEISFIKKDMESRKSPRILYVLGTYHGARKQFVDAKRFLRSAHAKAKEDARARGMIAADVLFCELCADSIKDLDSVSEFVKDIDAWEQNEPNIQMDWQFGRAKAVVASLQGKFEEARRLAANSSQVAPPLARKILDAMGESYGRKQRFTFESSEP